MPIQPISQKQSKAFKDSNARINIFEGPVRAGKSFVSLIRWIDFCLHGPKGPLILVGRNEKTIKRNIINPLQNLVGSALTYSEYKGEVYLWDRVMHVVGANDDRAEGKIRGSEFAGALVDEVVLIPENFIKMLLSRLSIPDAKFFGTTNPDSPFHWLKREFMDRQDVLDMKVFTFSIDDNPSLSEKYKADLRKEYQGLWYQRYIEGKWVLAEGAVYDFFDPKIHVIPQPPGVADYYVVGVDYGTTNPCAFSMVGYSGSTYPNMWMEKEYYYNSVAKQRQQTDIEYTKDLVDFIRGYNVKYIYIDPSAASFKLELRRAGINNIRDANNDVLNGIRYVSQLMSGGTLKIGSMCTQTIKEFSTYLWDPKASQRGVDAVLKENDHVLDSLRYCTYTHFFGKNQSSMTEEDANSMQKAYGRKYY
jgi:PBSX family phage terminase large subunit